MPASVDVRCLLHVHGFPPEIAEIPMETYDSFTKFGQVKEVLAFRTRTTSKNHLFVEFATPEEAAAARGKYAGGWQGDPIFPRAMMPVYEAMVDTSTSSSSTAAMRGNTYRWEGKAPIVPELLPPSVGGISLSRTSFGRDDVYRPHQEWDEQPWASSGVSQGIGSADDVRTYGEVRRPSREMGGQYDLSSHLGYKHGSNQHGTHERNGYVHGPWHDGKWLKNWKGSGTNPHSYRPYHPPVQQEHEPNRINLSESHHPHHYVPEKEPIAEPMSMRAPWPVGPRQMTARIGSLYSDRLAENVATASDVPKHSRPSHIGNKHRYISNSNSFHQGDGMEQYGYSRSHRIYDTSPSHKSHHYSPYHPHSHRHEEKYEKRRRGAEDESSERRHRSRRKERSPSPMQGGSGGARESRKHSRPRTLEDGGSKGKLVDHSIGPQRATSTIKVKIDPDATLIDPDGATEADMRAGNTESPVLQLSQSRAVCGLANEAGQNGGIHRSPPNHNNWKVQGSGASLALVHSPQNPLVVAANAPKCKSGGDKEASGNQWKGRPSTTLSTSSTGSRIFIESIADVAREQGLSTVPSNRKLSKTTGSPAQRQQKASKDYVRNEDRKRRGTSNTPAAVASGQPLECSGKGDECTSPAAHATHMPPGLVQASHDENWRSMLEWPAHKNDNSSALVTTQVQELKAELHIAEINRLRELYSISQTELLAERAAKRRAEDEIDKERAIRRRLEDEVWTLRVKHKLG